MHKTHVQAELNPTFFAYRPLLEFGKAELENTSVLTALAEWADLRLDSPKESTPLAAFALLQTTTVSEHRALLRSFPDFLRKTDPLLTECWRALRNHPPQLNRYEVYPSSGMHELIAKERGHYSHGLEHIETGTLCEADEDYCCERCDGPRQPRPNEESASGIYVGSLVLSRFLALGKVEEWAEPSITRLLDTAAAEDPKIVLQALLAPWALAA